MSSLKGKTALVTGSTSGIGLGMAIALAKQGANIMVNGFGEKDEAIAKIKACGVEVDYHGADMSKPAEIKDLIQQTEKRFGSLDILVNNAGIQHTASIEEFPTDKWDAIIAINLSSAFHTTHHALPGMKKRNWGRIINIASVHGLVASTQKAAYVAAKHGIVGLTKVTALENARTGITCNAIGPGFFPTALTAPVFGDPELVKMHANRTAIGRNGEMKDIYGLAIFLASDASSYITGQTIMLDGGYTAT